MFIYNGLLLAIFICLFIDQCVVSLYSHGDLDYASYMYMCTYIIDHHYSLVMFIVDQRVGSFYK